MIEEIKRFELVPLYDRVLIERVEIKLETPGGLIMPETMKEKPSEGYVVAAGSGRIREDGHVSPLAVKTGDKVLFGKYAGTDVKLNDKEYLLMREEDILGIIR